MAKKYIAEEAALEAIMKPKVSPDAEIFNALKKACQEEVKNLPAANVQEVRHGHWIRREGFDYENNVILGACSKCDWGVKDFTNYCPNCGAVMDESEGKE